MDTLSNRVANVVFEELRWYDHIFKYLSLCEVLYSEKVNWYYNQLPLLCDKFIYINTDTLKESLNV